MTQSKLGSLLEQIINTGIGFVISLVTWRFVAYYLEIPYAFSQAIEVTIIFTLVSIARGYLVRRYFNARIRRAAKKMAGVTKR